MKLRRPTRVLKVVKVQGSGLLPPEEGGGVQDRGALSVECRGRGEQSMLVSLKSCWVYAVSKLGRLHDFKEERMPCCATQSLQACQRMLMSSMQPIDNCNW
jgi:hypothetical protein